VGNDVGVFVSTNGGSSWSILGNLPAMPIVHFAADPSNPNRIVAATYGRGVYTYTFGSRIGLVTSSTRRSELRRRSMQPEPASAARA
jgi:hypothetical protein